MNPSDSKKLEEKPYPVQDGPTIPWSIIAPHEAQCKKNHGQSLKRLAERGGLGAAEAYCVVKGLSLDAFEKHGHERLRAWWYEYAESINGLKAKIAEQDREIERLRDIEWKWLNQDQTPGEIRAEEAEADCKRAGRKIDELAGMVQKTKAEREKLIGVLKKIKRDILEPDKIYIHLSRALGSELEMAEVKEKV